MEELFIGEIVFFIEGKKYQGKIGASQTDIAGVGIGFSMREENGGSVGQLKLDCRGKEVELQSLHLEENYTYQETDNIFVNGFQSWTESREYTSYEKIPRLRGPAPKLMNLSGDYTFFQASGEKGNFHSHDHTYVRDGVDYVLWKDLVPATGYTIFEHRTTEDLLRIKKDLAGLICTGEQIIYAVGRYEGERTNVFDQAFQQGRPLSAKGPVSGWTSWYYHYTKIDEAIILKNLSNFADRRIPIDFFQIDDGWQQAVGDWDTNEKFPQGLAPIAKRVHDNGYEAGLWLAPFIVDQRSTLFRDHKDWLVTFDGENFMPGGFNPGWGGLTHGYYYVLDIYKEEVREYLRLVFDRVLNEWGFDLVKLDFLYAVALHPRNGKSRGAIMADAMDLLRECCGTKKILGCGVPLASATDKVEYCRIGADIGSSWDMKGLALFNLRERISTRNSLHSTISRRNYSRRAFLNDPDVFMLRKEKSKLNREQRHSLFLLNLALGDLVFTSDDLANYDSETLRVYLSQFPHYYKETESIFQVDEMYAIRFSCRNLNYILLANLGGKKDTYELPEGIFFNQYTGLIKGGNILLKPFQSRVFLKIEDEQMILGGNGHLFPGQDVDTVNWKNGELNLVRHPHALADGEILIRVPEDAGTTILNKGAEKNVEKALGLRFVRAY